MRKYTPFRSGFWALALMAGLNAGSAHAGFQLTVTETGGAAIPIVDDGPLDLNTIAPGVITVNTAALNGLLTNFNFTSLSATSNRLIEAPASDAPASLTQTGAVLRISTVGSSNMTVNAFDTDFLFPSGNPKSMVTSSADTFSFTSGNTIRTFRSNFDPSNSNPPIAGIASPLLAFVPPTGAGPFGTSNPGVITALGTQPTPFALSNTTVVTLGAAGASTPTDTFTGTTTVEVPEPASWALLTVAALIAQRRLQR